jgi:hypothetical protein
VLKRVLDFIYPPEMDLINDERGFLGLALGIAQIAAPLIGKLFGGGAPTFEDLTQGTKDTSRHLTNAVQQSDEQRAQARRRNDRVSDLMARNARSVGAFDPTSLGSDFAFLGPITQQFSGADFGAKSRLEQMQRGLQILDRTQQMAQQAASMNLGIDQMLMQAGGAAGQGAGAGVGNAIAALGNQSTLGTGLGGFLSDLGGGAPGGGGDGFMMGPAQAEFPAFGPPSAGGTGSFPINPAPSGGGFDVSPMIQSILSGLGGGG